MDKTPREEAILRIAERAMNSEDPHEYVRAIGRIHSMLDTESGGMRIPRIYNGALHDIAWAAFQFPED